MINKFIDIFVPINVCNLKCHYCYISQYESNNTKVKEYNIEFKYSADYVKSALSQERLGGICHFNMCGAGETLIPENLIDYVRALLENGHSVMIVTNGILTNRFEQYCGLPEQLRSRLGFKFSFHYLQLKKLNLMETFFNNIKMVRNAGCSFSLELTPNDEYEPYIKDIKKLSIENVGALCHVTIPRNEPQKTIPLLSKHTIKEFNNIWNVFDSQMFDNKVKYWGEKRKEYCYAGYCSGLLNLSDGTFTACYNQKYHAFNIFKNLNKPIPWCPVGRCRIAHCFNGHSFLAFGDIPNLNHCTYAEVRDRIDINGKHWLTREMREHLSTKLIEETKLKNSFKLKMNFKRTGIKIKQIFYKVGQKFIKNKREH